MLDAAEISFSSMSYASVRVEDIAEAADVSVGTFYTHFGNKDGLFLAVAERALDRADRYIADGIDDAATPTEELVARGVAYLKLLRDHPSLTLFLASPANVPLDPAIQTRVRERIESLYADLESVIAAGVEANELAPVDARDLAVFLIGAWVGVLGVAANPATPDLSPDGAQRVIEQASAIMLAGLQPRAQQSQT